MSNADKFRIFLQVEKIHMQEGKADDGSIYFRAEHKLKDGWKILIGAAFTEDGQVVDLFCFNVAEIKNPQKKQDVYDVINACNTNFRYSKFYEEDGIVSVRYSYLAEGEFRPDLAFRRLAMLIETAEEAYPKLMETIWAL